MVIRKYVDHMITLAKDGSLHARRQVRAAFGAKHKADENAWQFLQREMKLTQN